MDCQFDDVLGRFCYKNHCNTIIAAIQTRVTRRVKPESLIVRPAPEAEIPGQQGYLGRWAPGLSGTVRCS